jgi:NADH-quinone oxidoreductase subunit N
MLLLGAFEQRKMVLPLAIIGMIASLALAIGDLDNTKSYFNNMLHINNISSILTITISVVMILILAISTRYYHNNVQHLSDIYALLIFSSIGAILMNTYNNLSMLFIALEVLSIPLYVLAGSNREDLRGNESALKYFILGAFASAIMLFGITLMFGATASFDLTEIATWASSNNSPMFQLGILLVVFGFLFKIAAAPFHFWTPDVYQGAPSIITLYMSTVVKIAAVGGFWRFLASNNTAAILDNVPMLPYLLGAVIVITLIVINFAALQQSSFKRLLAYSSISNAGLLLLPFITMLNPSAWVVYLVGYAVANCLLFTIYIAAKHNTKSGETAALAGLMKSQPILGVSLFIAMFSLAGIPPLAGFFGKFLLIATVANAQWWGLAVVAIIASLMALVYYIRVALIALQPSEQHFTCPAIYKYILMIGCAMLITLGLGSDIITCWLV